MQKSDHLNSGAIQYNNSINSDQNRDAVLSGYAIR
jgi:hypothetical protein